MSLDLLIDTTRLLVASYLLALAVAAVFGVHRDLLAYPAHAAYSAFRVVVLVLTLGRVRVQEDARRVKTGGARKARSLKRLRAEWNERRSEERALREGKPLFSESTQWASSASPTPAPAQAPVAAPEVEPTPAQPLVDGASAAGEDDEDDAPPKLF